MKVCKHVVAVMFIASFGLAGCGDDGTPPTMDAGGGLDANPPDSAMDAPTACPTPSSGPSMHSGAIAADETWSADASPHIVMGSVRIEGGATLTIEPCAVVRLASDGRLSAGSSSASGHLVAEGTASAPILFERADATAWDYLMAEPMGSVRLAYVTLSGGGGDAVTYDGASLVASGPADRPYVQNLFVDHVTVSGSAGYGVLMRRYSAFMTGATDLSVVDSGASDTAHPAPVRIDAEAVTTLPTGSYTGNASDDIEVDPFPAIRADTTFPDRGVPYHVMGSGELTVAGADTSGAVPTLTIEAGVTVTFDSGTGIRAGSSSASGHLIAEGTASAPILFERADATAWDYLMAEPMGSVRLAYVTLSGGGGDAVTYDGASLIANGPVDRPYVQNLFVDHVTVSGSAGYGVLMRRYSAFMTGASDLSVVDSGASDTAHPAPVRIDAEAVTTLPTGSYTGNASDDIEVDPFPAIRADTTFPDRGVPYHVMGSGELTVARADTSGAVPTLTLEAGVTIIFDSGARLGIGQDTTGHSHPGALVAQGTADAPVTLSSSAATPAAADWQGIGFATPPDPATDLIDYAVIEYAGSRNAIAGYSCSAQDSAGSLLLNDAAIFIYSWMPTSAFVTHSTITDSGGWGVLRGWKGDAVDFTPTNTFARIAHCDQSDPRAADGSCTGEPLTYACADTP